MSSKSAIYTPGAIVKSDNYAGMVSIIIPAGGTESLTLASSTACKVDNMILNFKDANGVSEATGSINVNLIRDLGNNKSIKVGLLGTEIEGADSIAVNSINTWITSIKDSIEVTNNTDKTCIIVIDFIY